MRFLRRVNRPLWGRLILHSGGDKERWNPEELLLASLSACHKLWYLGLCAQAGVVVTAYEDNAEACMIEEFGGAGQFVSAVLRPYVTIVEDSDSVKAHALHHRAHEMCFIARSVNFPVSIEPVISKADSAPGASML